MVGYSPEMVWLLHIISRVYYCSVWVIVYGITGGDNDRGGGGVVNNLPKPRC